MNCVIDTLINHQLKKGRKLDVLKRYLRMRYRINIDEMALIKRANETTGELRAT
jgi:hypothetical protein